jgi:hypothetical protein
MKRESFSIPFLKCFSHFKLREIHQDKLFEIAKIQIEIMSVSNIEPNVDLILDNITKQ